MMNKRFWLGMLVITLIFGMMAAGCDNGSTNDNNESGGSFTMTDIPLKYSGNYALLRGGNSSLTIMLNGYESYNVSTDTLTASLISNGSVAIPMWIMTSTGVRRYSGNDANIRVEVTIINSEKTSDIIGDEIARVDFDDYSVSFSNGDATKSFDDGTLYE